MFKKPELAEVDEFLLRRNALIVHFSGTPKGSGMERGHLFPADLKHVIAGWAMGGVSCSVVCPGDVFHDFKRNATGSVGVVLRLRSKDSLVAVDPDDAGSMDGRSGIRTVLKERDITVSDLDKTMDERTDYNEWVVKDYDVRGIFAVPPFEVWTSQMLEDFTEPVLAGHYLGPAGVVGCFPEQIFFTFKNGRIIECKGQEFISIHS